MGGQSAAAIGASGSDKDADAGTLGKIVIYSADAVVEKSSFMVVIFTRSPVEMEPVSVQEDLKPRQM